MILIAFFGIKKKTPILRESGKILVRSKVSYFKSTVGFDMYYIEKAVDVFVYQYCLLILTAAALQGLIG